ncbi:MAG: biopolymer transporter ExbD [Rikenellaceae bacterium]|nr:biopolymer transporter ExbD [Rikenellaceae bacterium]
MAIKRINKTEQSFGSASMTDLMFLLLIFLLVATTMINPNALKLVLPKGENQLKEKAYTSVSIDKNLNYYVEMQPVELDQLESVLQQKLASEETPTISLHTDNTVPIQNVVDVMTIATRNNYQLIMAIQKK